MTPLLAGLLMITAGVALHARAIHRLKSVLPGQHWHLTIPDAYLEDGIFRLRHPAYIGALLLVAGVGILSLGWGGACLAFAAFPFYGDRILREEAIRRGP